MVVETVDVAAERVDPGAEFDEAVPVAGKGLHRTAGLRHQIAVDVHHRRRSRDGHGVLGIAEAPQAQERRCVALGRQLVGAAHEGVQRHGDFAFLQHPPAIQPDVGDVGQGARDRLAQQALDALFILLGRGVEDDLDVRILGHEAGGDPFLDVVEQLGQRVVNAQFDLLGGRRCGQRKAYGRRGKKACQHPLSPLCALVCHRCGAGAVGRASP